MGKLILIARLTARDLRRHPAAAVLLLLAIATAATTLTVGLALRGVTSDPYARTRAATRGSDVVADVLGMFPPGSSVTSPRGINASPSGLATLEHAPGVTASSGPYPVTWALLRVHGITTSAMLEGRDPAPAAVDRPELTSGTWIRPGSVVVERSFADALGVRVGDRLMLGGRPFRVAGIAVSAGIPAYPDVCGTGCVADKQLSKYQPGLIWMPRSAAVSLASPAEPLGYFLNLKLRDPAQATAYATAYESTHTSASAPILTSWQQVAADNGKLVTGPQAVLLAGSWLLSLLAVASVAVLAGGRMAEQTRRVGLLKAVGATPGLVAAVLLFEHLVVALAAAAAGLAIGALVAPALTSPGNGLLGAPQAPPVTGPTAGIVIGVALAVAIVATLMPAVRAARTSTISALADAARPPRRGSWLITISSRLPIPLLFGLRLAARRPRRVMLGMLSIAVMISGVVAILAVRAHLVAQLGGRSALDNPQHDRLNQVMLLITVMLAVLAGINALLITWATVLDARHASAVARALGATPDQVSAGLCAAQLLSALPGTVLGIPLGLALYDGVTGDVASPPVWWLGAVVVGTLLAVTALTIIPARLGARRPPVETLQAELA